MAPGTPIDKDWEFLLSCLKHSNAKPDFEAIAKELELSSATAAYKKHWAIMQRYGLARTSGRGRKPENGVTKPAACVKRGRGTPSEAALKEETAADVVDEGNDLVNKSTLIKEDDDGENMSDIDTPSKKPKLKVAVKEEVKAETV